MQLFEARTFAIQPAFQLTEANLLLVAHICQRLDGIPLAIELAAARTRMLSLEQILAKLDDRFRLLTGGSRTALPRQQTLQALVEWSYDLLSDPERVLFRRLAVFSGGWTLEAAEQVCAGGEIQGSAVLDLLAHLVDKSLALAEPAGDSMRYRMLGTIRQYAGQRSQASGEQASLHQRHLDFYSQFVQESQKGLFGTDISACLKRLDAEKDNLYAALDWAIQTPGENAEVGQEMAGGLWMYWEGRGILSEGRQWLKKVLEKGHKRSGPRALALAGLGTLVWNLGEIQEATSLLDESLSILHALETPDLPRLAYATHIRGHIALDLGDYPFANQEFKESLELYREMDDPYWVGTLISDLGMVAYHQGDYSSARAFQEQSLVIHQKYGNIEVTSQTLHRIGEIARMEGDYGRAKECYETCLRSYQEIGMKLEIASNLHKLGFIAQHEGDLQKAHSRFRESLAIQSEAGNKQGIAECLAGLAGLAAVARQPVRALRLFGASRALLDAAKFPLAPADVLEWQRDHAVACGQLDESAVQQAQAEGRAMSMEQAIDYALQEDVTLQGTITTPRSKGMAGSG